MDSGIILFHKPGQALFQVIELFHFQTPQEMFLKIEKGIFYLALGSGSVRLAGIWFKAVGPQKSQKIILITDDALAVVRQD
jgi:hypothetical protein